MNSPQKMQSPGVQVGALRDPLCRVRSPHLHIASGISAQTLDEASRQPLWAWPSPLMSDQPFTNHRDAALALLNANRRLTRDAGRFLGQLTVDPAPLSKRQADWLENLLERSGLPPMSKDGSE